MNQIQEILSFWFDENGYDEWFGRDEAFDAKINARFSACHQAVQSGQCRHWCETADGRLASILVLDQFSRNLFRGQAAAFQNDAQARAIARTAIAHGDDQNALSPDRQMFYYVPFEHSEQLEDQERSLIWLSTMGDDRLRDAAQIHYDIIARFGRFPHRNAALGRETTAEEAAFLENKLPFY